MVYDAAPLAGDAFGGQAPQGAEQRVLGGGVGGVGQ